MRKRSSRIDPKRKKPKGDLLTWKTATAAAVLMAAATAVGRAHATGTGQATALIAGACLVATVDMLHGNKRAIAGTIGALAWVYHLAVTMPAGKGFLLPAVALIYSAVAIGWKGTKKRRQARLRSTFNDIKGYLPPDTKLRGKPMITAGLTRIKFKVASGSAKWDSRQLKLNVASDAGVPVSQVDVVDLSDTVEGGLHELVIRGGRPFDFPDPTYPERSTWPKGKIPLGWDINGDTVWLDMSGSRGKHTMICGRTGAGKTNTQRVLLAGLRSERFELWLIDPHNEFEDYHPAAGDRIATSATEGALLLKRLVAEMRQRLEDRARPRPPIVCMVDETPAVLKVKGAEDAANSLAMEGRKVGIVLILAVQYPTVELFGGPLRQQMSTVIAHRMKDTTGSLVALGPGSVKAGWDASDKRHMQKQGRAIAELDGASDVHQYVQVFPAPDAPLQPEVVEAKGWPMPMPPADAWPVRCPSVRPPSGGVEQGEQAADGRTDGHNLSTDLSPDLKGLEARILPILNGHPLSGRQVAETIGASPDGVNKALKRLETKGLAVQNGGWLKA